MKANALQNATANHQLKKSVQSNFVGLCDGSALDLGTSLRIKSTVTMRVEPINQNCNECVTICATLILLWAKYSCRLLPGPINARSKAKLIRSRTLTSLVPLGLVDFESALLIPGPKKSYALSIAVGDFE
jgi:hypothetical protein